MRHTLHGPETGRPLASGSGERGCIENATYTFYSVLFILGHVVRWGPDDEAFMALVGLAGICIHWLLHLPIDEHDVVHFTPLRPEATSPPTGASMSVLTDADIKRIREAVLGNLDSPAVSDA